MKNGVKNKAYEEMLSFKISSEGRSLIDKMADQDYIDRSRFIRRLIAEEAARRGIEISEVVKYEIS